MSINKVMLTGNLTREPELRTTAAGTPTLSFGIAVNDRIKNNQTDQWEDKPNYVDCVMFGNRAQSVSRFINKGSKVTIEGKLSWSQWKDRQTDQNRSKLEVIVSEIEFMSQGQQAAPAYAPQPAQAAYAPQAYQQPPMQQTPVQQPVMVSQPPMQPVQQMPMQQQMVGMPQPNVVTPSVYDEDIPF